MNNIDSEDLGNGLLSAPEVARSPRYWDGKFVATNAILLLLSAIAAYLQYSVYPAIITQEYGETNVALHISLLTYSWSATKCIGGICARLAGLWALDFFQIFILAVFLLNISRFISMWRNRNTGSQISQL